MPCEVGGIKLIPGTPPIADAKQMTTNTYNLSSFAFTALSDDSHVFLANTYAFVAPSISVFDIATGTMIANITDPSIVDPIGLVWAGAELIYVINWSGTVITLNRFDFSLGTITDSGNILSPTHAFNGAWDGGTGPGTGTIYITAPNANYLAGLDVATGSIFPSPLTDPSFDHPNGIAFDGVTHMFVANFGSGGNITRINTNTFTIDSISLGPVEPYYIAWDHSLHMYVVCQAGNVVRILASTGAVDGDPIVVGNTPIGVGYNGKTDQMFVTVAGNIDLDPGTSSMAVISIANATIDYEITDWPSDSALWNVIWDGYEHIYVTEENDGYTYRLFVPGAGASSTVTIPDINSATSNSDYAWIGGMREFYDGRGSVVRFNPSSIVHKNNDTINTVSLPDASDLTSAQLLLNALKSSFNAHMVQAGVHIVNDVNTSNYVSNADATDIATPVSYFNEAAIVNSLKAKINGHFIRAGVHVTNDTVNTITDPDISDPTNLVSIITLANTVASHYNAHRVQSGVHIANDNLNTEDLVATNLFELQQLLIDLTYTSFESHTNSFVYHLASDGYSTPDAIITLSAGQYPTATSLANQISDLLNYHFGKDGIHYHWDSNFVTAPYADSHTMLDLPGIIALANNLKSVFNTHLSQLRRLVHQTSMITVELSNVPDPFPDSGGFFGTQTLLNDVKSKFNIHIADPGVHLAPSKEAVTAADANESPPTWATAAFLANNLVASFNSHIMNSGGDYHVQVDDSLQITSSPADSSDLLSIINVTNQLAGSIGFGNYNEHIINRDYYKLMATVGFGHYSVFLHQAIDGYGNMYVNDYNYENIRKFNITTGSFVDINLGSFHSPQDICWVGNYMYVATDDGSEASGTVTKIKISDNSTSTLASIGGSYVHRIAYDGSGFLYVTHNSFFFNFVSRVNINTGGVTTISSGIDFPSGIVNGGDGYMWVAHGQTSLVKIKISTGTVSNTVPLSFTPKIITSDPDGYIWTAGWTGGSIARVTKSDNTVLDFPQYSFNSAVGACYDGYGHIYFSFPEQLVILDITKDETQTPVFIQAPQHYSFGDIIFDGYSGLFVEFEPSLESVSWITKINRYSQTFEIIQIHPVNDTVNSENNPIDNSGVISDVTLSAVQTRLNDLQTQFNAHIASATYHLIADVTNTSTASPATDIAPSFTTMYDLAIDLRAKINDHLTEPGLHYNDDLVSTLADTSNYYRPAAPVPSSNMNLTEIINLSRAIGSLGYITTNLITSSLEMSSPIGGAHNYHVLQPSNFIDTILPIGSSNTVSMTTIDLFLNYYLGLVVVSQDDFGVPFFSTIFAAAMATPATSVNVFTKGILQNSFDFTALTDQYRYPHSLSPAIINFTPNVWFLSGGHPNETVDPYRLNIITNIASPSSPFVPVKAPPYSIAFETGKVPVDITAGGFAGLTAGGGEGGPYFEFDIVRIAYSEADYVGDYFADFYFFTGTLDQMFKYPIGGALKFANISEVIGKTTWFYQFDTPVILNFPSFTNIGDGYVEVGSSHLDDIWICSLNLDAVDDASAGGAFRIVYSTDNGSSFTALPGGTAFRDGWAMSVTNELTIQVVATGLNVGQLRFYVQGAQGSTLGENLSINRLSFVVRKG